MVGGELWSGSSQVRSRRWNFVPAVPDFISEVRFDIRPQASEIALSIIRLSSNTVIYLSNVTELDDENFHTGVC